MNNYPPKKTDLFAPLWPTAPALHFPARRTLVILGSSWTIRGLLWSITHKAGLSPNCAASSEQNGSLPSRSTTTDRLFRSRKAGQDQKDCRRHLLRRAGREWKG